MEVRGGVNLMVLRETYRGLVAICFFFVLLICLVLHQYGPSYHLTFGSLGLLLVIAANVGSIRKSSLAIAFLVVVAMTASHMVFIARYQDEAGLLRMFRITANAFFVFLIIRNRNSVGYPSEWTIATMASLLFALAAYQYFFDLTFRLPSEWLALGDELVAKSDEIFFGMSRRVAGIFSDPSAFALVFCCFLAFGLRMDSRLRLPTILISVFGIVITGSLLGAIGIAALFGAAVYSGRVDGRKAAVLALVFMMLGVFAVRAGIFELAILNRSYETGSVLDDSTMTRLFRPFILIFKIFSEGNIFGYPGDIYEHFLYEGIYVSLGDFPGHNGLLALVMQYGLFGLAFVWLLFRQLKSADEAVMLVIIGSQSGNLFSYEKSFMILFVILALRSMSELRSQRLGRVATRTL